MKFEQPPVLKQEKEEENKESELEVLNLSEIIPDGVEIEGVEELQRNLNKSFEDMMEARERMQESLQRMKSSIEKDSPEEQAKKAPIFKKICSAVLDKTDNLAGYMNKKLEQFVKWGDDLMDRLFSDNKYKK